MAGGPTEGAPGVEGLKEGASGVRSIGGVPESRKTKRGSVRGRRTGIFVIAILVVVSILVVSGILVGFLVSYDFD